MNWAGLALQRIEARAPTALVTVVEAEGIGVVAFAASAGATAPGTGSGAVALETVVSTAGSVARVWSVRSKVSNAAEAFASFTTGSKPNIATVNLHGSEGSPPISNRPSPSVTVEILSAPQSAVTAAPGIGWPPDFTTPF